MTELLTIAEKLSGISLATMMIIIIGASYFGKWQWTRDCDARIKEIRDGYQAQIVQLKDDLAEWKSFARGTARTAEAVVEKIKGS